VEIQDKKVRLVRAVKSKIEPEKLAKKKNSPSSTAPIGG